MERRSLDNYFSWRSSLAPQDQFGGYSVARLDVHGYSGLVRDSNVSAAPGPIDMNRAEMDVRQIQHFSPPY